MGQLLRGPNVACLALTVQLLCCSVPASLLASPGSLTAGGGRRQRASMLRNQKNLGISVAVSISVSSTEASSCYVQGSCCIPGSGGLTGMAWDLSFVCCWELLSCCGQSPVALLLTVSKCSVIANNSEQPVLPAWCRFENCVSHTFCCWTFCLRVWMNTKRLPRHMWRIKRNTEDLWASPGERRAENIQF